MNPRIIRPLPRPGIAPLIRPTPRPRPLPRPTRVTSTWAATPAPWTPAARGGFGALTSQQEAQLASVAAGTAASAIAAGAAAGSVAGPIGTAVGAVVGVVVTILTKSNNTASHIGGWDGSLANAIGGLPASAAGIGRQIPWNENSHGLTQMIEALLATGLYMAWDTSLISSYDVCAHWAMTFAAAVQTVVGAIVNNPVGKSVTVSIALSPGAGHGPTNFTFVNPGIQVGPDKISANIIMGSKGLMAAMMTGLGGQAPQNIASNASNALAQKVFALMVDYQAAQLAPAAAQPSKPVTTAVAPAVAAASSAANASVAASPSIPATANTQPIAAATPTDDSVLMAQNQAILSAMQNLEAQGVNTSTPQGQAMVQAAVAAPATGLFGLSNTTLLILGGIAVAAFLYMEKGK